MKRIKIIKSCRYADPTGPHMPQFNFVAGTEVDVSDEVAESLIDNDHGHEVDRDREKKVVKAESKEQSGKSKRERKGR